MVRRPGAKRKNKTKVGSSRGESGAEREVKGRNLKLAESDFSEDEDSSPGTDTEMSD